jgi:hypothetical protein
MRHGVYLRLALRLAPLILLGLGISGCALFTKPPSQLLNKAFKLPTIGIPPGAIQLEVVYVERPLGDARLGDELWRYADELSINPEQRAMLRRNGYRAGVVGSNPPYALQQMLGLKDDFTYEPEAEKSKQWVGHRYILRSGSHQTIDASPVYPACSLDIPQGNQNEHHSFENAQGKYRVTAERLQDGWVQLDFVPQIHHGAEQLRRVVGPEGWQFQNGQSTETLYAQRFNVRLHVGDMAIITAADEARGRLGELFFRGPAVLTPPGEGDAPAEGSTGSLTSVQRLLVVRLAAMGSAEPPPAATKQPPAITTLSR